MFSYLRYFFGASIIIILLAAVLLGMYYRVAADNLIKLQVQQNNIAISKSFTNTVWKDYAPIMSAYFYAMTPEDRLKYKEFNDFGDKTVKLLQDIEVVRFNLYTPKGELLFTSTNTGKLSVRDVRYYIKGKKDSKLSPLAAITQGTDSEIIYDAEYIKPPRFKNEKAVPASGVLVRTLIPLRPDNAPDNVIADPAAPVAQKAPVQPQAVLEIFFDVTSASATLRNFQFIGVGLIIAVFMVLYFTLIYTSRRAEKIIEKQHEANIELAAAKATAENENRQKSQFLANISHELRTPLNAIIGFSEIIKDEVMGELNNDQYKNYIKDIHSSGVHLLSLINDILDYSKAEAGKLEFEYEDIDLTKLITSSLRLQEPRAKNAEVELLKELPDEHIIIKSDGKRLKQVLLNLLSNAVKFTPSGGSVKISAWRNMQDQNSVSIEVKDSGIGIAPKDIAKALAPFGQVDSELSRRYEGTGLGLPLTKKFIELMGGHLKLESEVNKGTTITVTLPINSTAQVMAAGELGGYNLKTI